MQIIINVKILQISMISFLKKLFFVFMCALKYNLVILDLWFTRIHSCYKSKLDMVTPVMLLLRLRHKDYQKFGERQVTLELEEVNLGAVSLKEEKELLTY